MKASILERLGFWYSVAFIAMFVVPILVFYDRLDYLVGFYAVWLFDNRNVIKYAIGR